MIIRKDKSLNLVIIILLFLLPLFSNSAYANYDIAPIPLSSAFQLINMAYDYNPQTQTLTKQYQFKNISGKTLLNPRMVNLFLWSNNICSIDWLAMVYNGTSIFSNSDQSATVTGNDGTINWSSQVYPYSLNYQDYMGLFPSASLQPQSVQNGISYPYWNIASPWHDQDTRTIDIQFSNVTNCNWIQNVVWIIYSEEGSPPTTSVVPTTTTTAIPTVITLSYFQAIPGDNEVTLVWRTESEVDTAGFNIYRRKEWSNEFEKINSTLILAKGTATTGAEYTYTDTDVKNGVVYIYILEDIENSGVATRHKPVRVRPRWIYSLFH